MTAGQHLFTLVRGLGHKFLVHAFQSRCFHSFTIPQDIGFCTQSHLYHPLLLQFKQSRQTFVKGFVFDTRLSGKPLGIWMNLLVTRSIESHVKFCFLLRFNHLFQRRGCIGKIGTVCIHFNAFKVTSVYKNVLQVIVPLRHF